MIAISQDTVNYIIALAREVREAAPAMMDAELDREHDTDHFTQMEATEVVNNYAPEDHASDSVFHALKSSIENLNVEEQHNLVAITWVGRGTYGKDEWQNALTDAKEASNDHTADYLMNIPLFPDYLEEGLTQLDRHWVSEN